MSFQCIVVTPEETALDETVDFVAVPLFDGELGIGTGHSPVIGRLGIGELRIRTGSDVRRYYIEGGFVEVADNVVSVLTERAIPAIKIDGAQAAQALAAARSQTAAGTDDQFEIRDRAQHRARAQVRIAGRTS